ncbi:MAG: sigma-70 family RNA polymerase sigma factor [Planctomycetia bacterium]|nr:sigma-70 family RNA polymerase sigma factor [Planctomycetia bacterium]
MGRTDEQRNSQLERYREYLLILARLEFQSQLRGQFDPSDLVQQTLLDAHEKRQQFRGQNSGELAAWLRQILARNLVDALRRLGRAKRDIGRERSLEAALETSSLRLGSWLTTQESSPSHKAHSHEQAVRLADALGQLPDAQREALVLQNWHGRSLAQIGEEMGRSPAAVAGLIKRGLKQLRESLRNLE